jgi:putative protease
LKIEGRARSPEYVKTVTECYDEAIASCIDGTFSRDKTKAWENRLSQVFNRGFWNGYYLGQEMGEWSEGYGSNASKRKIYIGKGMNYFSRLGVAEFLVESNEINVGDEILVTGPTTGVMELTVAEIQVGHKRVKTAAKGENFSMPVPGIIRRSDKLFKLVDAGESGQQ